MRAAMENIKKKRDKNSQRIREMIANIAVKKKKSVTCIKDVQRQSGVSWRMLKQAGGMERRNKRKSAAIQSKKRERLHRVVSAMSTELPTKKLYQRIFNRNGC